MNQATSLIFYIVFSLLLFCTIPAVANKLVFQMDFKSLGLTFPEKKWSSLFLTLLAILIFVASFYFLAKHTDLKTYYTLKNPTFFQLMSMIFLFPIYYFAEEFFFRGFLFMGLWRRVRWNSFWITDIIFTLSHIGKPGIEILYCIPASVVFNALTLYSRSIYPAFITHFMLGIINIIMVNYIGI